MAQRHAVVQAHQQIRVDHQLRGRHAAVRGQDLRGYVPGGQDLCGQGVYEGRACFKGGGVQVA